MAMRVLALFVSFCVVSSARAATPIQGLPNRDVRAVLVTADSRFVLDYADRFVIWRDRILYDGDMSSGPFAFDDSQVGVLNDDVHAVWTHKPLKGEASLTWKVCKPTGCTEQVIFVDVSTDDRQEKLRPLAFLPETDGMRLLALHTVSLKVEVDDGNGGKKEEWRSTSDKWLMSEDKTVGTPGTLPVCSRYLRDGNGGLVGIERGIDSITLHKIVGRRGTAAVTIAPALYDYDVVPLNDGRLRVFLHDPQSRQFKAATVDLDAKQVELTALDEAESGVTSVGLSRDPAQTVAAHYFYRNAFYKGVKISRVAAGFLKHADLDATYERNAGFDLRGAVAPDGRLLLAYENDTLADSHVVLSFASLDDLESSTKPEPTDWTRSPSAAFVEVGLGAVYATFGLRELRPNGLDDLDVSRRYRGRYRINPGMNTLVLAEAKVGGMRFGASYAQSLVQDEIKTSLGKNAERAFQMLAGFVGVDDLVPYHDVQVRAEWTRLNGTLELSTPTSEVLPVDSERRFIELALLNTYRTKYGLRYLNFHAPMPVYLYRAEEGEAASQLVDSGMREVAFHDLALFVGYSLLDYTAKYEVNVSRFFVDATLALGGSFVVLDREIADRRLGGAPVLGGDLEAGYLLQLRSYALHGLGGFAKVGVRAQGSIRLDDKPGERKKEDRGSRQETLVVGRAEGYVGPFVQMGIVY